MRRLLLAAVSSARPNWLQRCLRRCLWAPTRFGFCASGENPLKRRLGQRKPGPRELLIPRDWQLKREPLVDLLRLAEHTPMDEWGEKKAEFKRLAECLKYEKRAPYLAALLSEVWESRGVPFATEAEIKKRPALMRALNGFAPSLLVHSPRGPLLIDLRGLYHSSEIRDRNAAFYIQPDGRMLGDHLILSSSIAVSWLREAAVLSKREAKLLDQHYYKLLSDEVEYWSSLSSRGFFRTKPPVNLVFSPNPPPSTAYLRAKEAWLEQLEQLAPPALPAAAKTQDQLLPK